MIHKIKSILISLGFCTEDSKYIAQDIYKTYTSSNRHYHDIKHIANMLFNLNDFNHKKAPFLVLPIILY